MPKPFQKNKNLSRKKPSFPDLSRANWKGFSLSEKHLSRPFHKVKIEAEFSSLSQKVCIEKKTTRHPPKCSAPPHNMALCLECGLESRNLNIMNIDATFWGLESCCMNAW